MPLATPQWLTDTEEAAPCFCGRPIEYDKPWMLFKTYDGLKRQVHLECASAAGLLGSD